MAVSFRLGDSSFLPHTDGVISLKLDWEKFRAVKPKAMWRTAVVSVILIATTAVEAQAPLPAKETATAVNVVGEGILPTVYFNHLLLVLPKSVYAAIAASPFMREQFCGSKEQTTSREGGHTYGGNYLFGRRTYLEFFEATSATPESLPAVVEFGMWADTRDQLPELIKVLHAGKDLGWTLIPFTVTLDGKEVPIYDFVTDTGGKSVETGYKAADLIIPDYFKIDNPGQRLDVFLLAPRSRKGLLSVPRDIWQRASYKPDALLNDVTGIDLAATAPEIERAVHGFTALGLAVSREKSGDTVVDGPEIRIRLHPTSGSAPREVALHLVLNRPVPKQDRVTFTSGSDLTFGEGPTAVWRFTIPRQ